MIYAYNAIADGLILSVIALFATFVALIPLILLSSIILVLNGGGNMLKRIILAMLLTAALIGFLLLFNTAGNENSSADLLYQNTVQPPLPLCVCATLTPTAPISLFTPTPPPTQILPSPSPSPTPTRTTIPLPTDTPSPTATRFTFPTPTQEVGLNPTSAPVMTWRVAVTAGVVTHSWDGARFVRRTQALPYLTEFAVDMSQAGWCRLDTTINVYRVRSSGDVWIPWRDVRLGMVYAAPVSAEVGPEVCMR